MPARRGAAESVAGAERALRILDRDLRNLCQRFFKESENCPGSVAELVLQYILRSACLVSIMAKTNHSRLHIRLLVLEALTRWHRLTLPGPRDSRGGAEEAAFG